jgi:hypothetical protein
MWGVIAGMESPMAKDSIGGFADLSAGRLFCALLWAHCYRAIPLLRF